MINSQLMYELPEKFRGILWSGVKIHLPKSVIDKIIEGTSLTSSKVYRLLHKYFCDTERLADYVALDGSKFYLVTDDSYIDELTKYCQLNSNTKINSMRGLYTYVAGPKLKNKYDKIIGYTYCYSCKYRGDSSNCEFLKHPTLSMCPVGKSILGHKDGSYYYTDISKEHSDLLLKDSDGNCKEDENHYVKQFIKMGS